MSVDSSLRSEDQYLCSICLNVLTDPVITPCGHNFCQICITQHWDGGHPYKQQAAKPGEVPCDICTGTRLKALKSCLMCLLSYCETHLEPHLTKLDLTSHQLVDPVENLEDRVCQTHNKLLELFCRTDQTCVCSLCPVLDHQAHEFVPLMEECEGKKAELEKTDAKVQKMIRNRRLKIEEIKESVKISKDAADKQKAEGVQVFTRQKKSVERSLTELIKEIEVKQKTTEKRAEDLVKDLEQEISELMKRSSEVKQLSGSEDHLHLLQRFNSLKGAPPTRNLRKVRVHPPLYEGTVVRAVEQLEKKLRNKMKNLLEAELKWVQQFAVDVTLDPGTAYPYLVLSADGKQVYESDEENYLPDNPKRFSECPFVLGKQSFSSGRFYFEVQVEGKTVWDLGVAKSSVHRKGMILQCSRYGYWTVGLYENQYDTSDTSDDFHLYPGPEKVGVFVDYEEGVVSFYDVDAPALIYSFTGCSFSDKLHPIFCPGGNDEGKNSAPLIICPVDQSV